MSFDLSFQAFDTSNSVVGGTPIVLIFGEHSDDLGIVAVFERGLNLD